MGKTSASFKVELLARHKAKAHKRLGVYDAPGVWSYARSYMEEHGKLFEIEGFIPVSLGISEIDKISEDHGLIEFKNWAAKNCVVHSDRFGRCGLETHTIYTWLRFPDGLWALKGRYGRWLTWDRRAGKKGLENDPDGDIRKANSIDAESLKDFDYDAKRRFEKIESEFENAWKAARTEYRKELKASGKAENLALKEANENHVKRTKIRMDVLSQATKLHDMLEVYIKCVNDETMTVSQVGELYRELTKLGSLNLDMKKIYGNKIKKK